MIIAMKGNKDVVLYCCGDGGDKGILHNWGGMGEFSIMRCQLLLHR